MQTRLATIMRGAGPNRLSKTVGTIVAVIGLALLVILPVPQSAARPLAGLDTTPDLTQTGQLDHNNIVAPADLSAIENEATRSEPHEQAVRCMAVSPNGRFLIVGRGNWATPGRVRVWDVEQRREVFYTDEKWGVAAVAVSSDNKYFASSTWGDEHVVSVRSTETFKLQSRFATGKKVVRLAFSPNGDLATASEAGELRIWSPLDGSEIRKFGTEPYSLTKLAFSPDGKWLAACGGDINPSASAGSERSSEPSGRAVVWNVATGTQRFSLPPQDNPLLDIAFSNDGNTIATLGVGRSVRVWNATTGHEEANFKNQVSPLSIDFCPASDRLLASFADGRVKVWDVASQTLNSEFRPSQSPVMAAKFSVDGTGVFATNEFARVQLFQNGGRKIVTLIPHSLTVPVGARLASIASHASAIHASDPVDIAISPNQTYLAAAYNGEQPTVVLHDLKTGQQFSQFMPDSNISDIEFSSTADSSTGDVLVVACRNGVVEFHALSGAILGSLPTANRLAISRLAISANGRQLAVLTDNSDVQIGDVTTRRWLPATYASTPNTELDHISFSADHGGLVLQQRASPERGHMGRLIVLKITGDSLQVSHELESNGGEFFFAGAAGRLTVLSSGQIRCYDSSGNLTRQTRLNNHLALKNATFFRDGKLAALVDGRDEIGIWNLETGAQVLRYVDRSSGVRDLTVSTDGSLLASLASDGAIHLDSTSPRRDSLVIPNHDWTVRGVDLSPDNKWALTSRGTNSSLAMWDVSTSKLVRRFRGHQGNVICVAFSPDGNRVVSGSYDHTVRIWDTATGECLSVLQGHSGNVESVAISADGKWAASACEDETVGVWNLLTGREHLSLPAGDWATKVAFSPAGESLAAGAGRECRIWRIADGKQLLQIRHDRVVCSIAYAPSGSQIFTGDKEGHLRIWNARSGILVNESRGHRRPIEGIAISPDGATALTAGHDGKMLRWEVENLEVIDRFVGHRGEVNSIAIASDGSFAISGGQDKTARIWNLHRQSIVGETANLVRAWQSTSPIADLTINHGVGSKDK